jgi:hypothetical protein
MGRTRSASQNKRKNGLNEDTPNLTVHIKYKDVEQTFSGNAEEVWININKFFSQLLPSFEIAKKLLLMTDLEKLVRQCEGIIALAPEGPNLMIPRNKLTDNETIALLLLAAHVAFKLGKAEKDTLTKEAIQAKLGKEMKITSTRLGELVKTEIIGKTDDDNYRITTFGALHMQNEVLPKLRSKTFC